MSERRVMTRREFVAAGGACVGGALLPGISGRFAAAAVRPTIAGRGAAEAVKLQAVMRTIEVNGKSARMMGLEHGNGKHGLSLVADQPFEVLLENKMPVPTAIHWHGLHPPNAQDGVPNLTQPVIPPGGNYPYNFAVKPAGTHWMHSHEGLQEAYLLAAPLIVHDPADKAADEQEVILFLGDFSFTTPEEIFARLRKPKPAMKTADHGATSKPDANDVDYDAYLANDRTLADPEVVRVEKNGKVRLRIINGSSGTNYFISMGDLKGELIATDGMPVQPVRGSLFPLAIAQRIDVRVQLPAEGAFPILAPREGAMEQTGFVLATPGAVVKKLPVMNEKPAGLLTLELESQLVAAQQPAAKTIDRSFDLRLGGLMSSYDWPINGVIFDIKDPRSEKAAVVVKEGQRAAIKFINETGMSHPMHLHGHAFQVIDINGKALMGALRDTLLVPPKTSVTVAFDANNPGIWYVHCHILWHLAAGMAALVRYET